ncbi:hypothetical protein CEXT_458361 [Caerostris extrusa]|uniref:Uncharacterized protein n=1 Tax=Caerostris extrusa TaxID=172846 RepID=A0AAV4V3F6_CAEEX|nr:hypothetical protein CEXT_458361 [Caerostris extrusa]
MSLGKVRVPSLLKRTSKKDATAEIHPSIHAWKLRLIKMILKVVNYHFPCRSPKFSYGRATRDVTRRWSVGKYIDRVIFA